MFKSKLLFISFFLVGTIQIIHSQTHFKPGYIIDLNGKKVECQIWDEDWKYTPKSFKYTLSGHDEPLVGNVENVKEFGIAESSRYIRFVVDIDKSTTNLNYLTTSRYPENVKDTLYLKLILEGEKNLYQYEGGDFERFFIQEKGKEPGQLVYKTYSTTGTDLMKNEDYKQQLNNALRCDCINIENIKAASYNLPSLTRLFIKYYNCTSSEFTQYKKERKSSQIKIKVCTGAGLASMSTNYYEHRPAEFNWGGQLVYVLVQR